MQAPSSPGEAPPAPPEPIEWRTAGSALLGLELVRTLDAGGSRVRARVVSWLPAGESDFFDEQNKPAALYKIRYLDGALAGDHEDLEAHEVAEAAPAPEAPRSEAHRRAGAAIRRLVAERRDARSIRLRDAVRQNRAVATAPRLQGLLAPRRGPAWRAAPTPVAPRWAAFAAVVARPEDLGDGWRAGGHSFVGRETVRAHGERGKEERMSSGVVVAWLPAASRDPFRDREGEPADLFRLRFKDGDLSGEIEDLEAYEVEQCLVVDTPHKDDVEEGPYDRPWAKLLQGDLRLPLVTRGQLTCRRLERTPPLPPSTAFSPLSRSLVTEDQASLTYTPYLGEKEDGVDLLDGYDASAKQRALDAGVTCPALRDRDLHDLKSVVRDVLQGCGDVEPDVVQDALVAHGMRRADALLAVRGQQIAPGAKKRTDTGHRTYDDDVDSLRKILCRRCFLYDCNRHGLQIFGSGQPRRGDRDDVFPACSQITDAPPLFWGARDVDIARRFRAGPSNAWGDREERALPRALVVFGGCVARAAQALNVAGKDVRMHAAAQKLDCSPPVEGGWCCRRCAPHAPEVEVEEVPAPLPKKRKKGSGPKKPGAPRNAKPHPDRKFKAKSIESPAVYCRHEGRCTLENCECLQLDQYCSKFCGCAVARAPTREPDGWSLAHEAPDFDDSTALWLQARHACRGDASWPPPPSKVVAKRPSLQSCRNQFPGCQCKSHCQTRACPCFAAGRECDADTCGVCGAAKARDYPDLEQHPFRCRNRGLARKQTARTALAESTIPGAGWGLFAPHGASKGDLMCEYVGEVLSQPEAERRGKVYDKINSSYLFNLDEEAAVDATRYGNKSRFANHSSAANCGTRTVLVDGTHRIGLYAARDIPREDELFFDYRYLVESETAGQKKVAVLVDWMADASQASNVSTGRGARVLDASAALALARPAKKRRGPAAKKHSG